MSRKFHKPQDPFKGSWLYSKYSSVHWVRHKLRHDLNMLHRAEVAEWCLANDVEFRVSENTFKFRKGKAFAQWRLSVGRLIYCMDPMTYGLRYVKVYDHQQLLYMLSEFLLR